jgi:hypothetical protein
MDNPNPKANIGILCSYQFFFYAFLSTYRHLSKIANVEFILDFTTKPIGSEYPEEYKEQLRNMMREEGVFFRDITLGKLLPGEFFEKYGVLVASTKIGYMGHMCNKDKKKVRVMYGLAKDGWAYGLYNAYFDLILCPGIYSYERLKKLYSAKIVSVGEPKLDALYQDGFVSQKTKEIEMRLQKHKKTLLYMPTWGVLSSSSVTVPSLLSLLPDYTILVKIHHMTALFSPEEMKYLYDDRFVILNESVPVTDALKLADVVISDSSGSIFDAMVAKKGLVLIDTIRDVKTFFTEAPFFTYQKNKDVAGVVSSSESLEQTIKSEGVTPVVALKKFEKQINVDALRKAIEVSQDDVYRNAQKDFITHLYAYTDGNAGVRAAEEIAALVYTATDRDKTLERYVDEYEHKIRTESEARYGGEFKKMQEFVGRMKGIKRMPLREKVQLLYQIFIEGY